MDEKRLQTLLKGHSEYTELIYRLAFVHGYKHGYDDAKIKGD